jgi:hypothetical protein
MNQINKTHPRLGELIAMNVVAAKAKKTILNVSPSGCGKSTSTDTVAQILSGRSLRFTSLTLAGLVQLKKIFSETDAHVIIDDLGAEKSIWSRVSTITTLANLCYGHGVDKVTYSGRIQVTNFTGGVSLNVQPVLMNTLVQEDDWIAVVRDKVLRYYHLYRPIEPVKFLPDIKLDWGEPITNAKLPKKREQPWYQLISIGLTQWGFSRVIEHIPDLLKACAVLDKRKTVNNADYELLISLLQPMQIERYLIETYGFETGRVFNNNFLCILVELATFKEPTIEQIAIDYKINPATARNLCLEQQQWCWIKDESPPRVMPTEQTTKILDVCGVK